MNCKEFKRVKVRRFTPTARVLYENLQTGLTVIDPAGSEINARVPLNRAAKKPTQTAPYKPPKGLTPKATLKAKKPMLGVRRQLQQ
jgi:hypothetical protein